MVAGCFLLGVACGGQSHEDEPEPAAPTGGRAQATGGHAATEAGAAGEPTCGDGRVDGGEECDDGNAKDYDECLNDCSLATCGDGIVNNYEYCDEGEDNSWEFWATCPPDCSTNDHCFNGVWEPEKSEECDDDSKADTSSCTLSCELNVCGDGYAYLDETPGTNNTNPLHLCDDFNDDDSDACTSDCAWNVCGDGFVFSKGYGGPYHSEDDGNELDDNPNPTEECDDGNDEAGDGCFECAVEVCGNGIVDEGAGEECDDGNANNNDDCLNTCKLPTCGDGILHNLGTGDEWCDDGEDNGPFPARCSATCGPHHGCGNGEPDPGQDCDDGDLNGDTASCLSNCVWNVCGDGTAYLDATPGTENPTPVHACDDDNDDESDACTSDCAWNVCGDGFVFSKGYGAQYEDADDGNELDDNPNPTEECDDGNDEAGDGCFECQLED
jgi:cysteine-rich repeat protein